MTRTYALKRLLEHGAMERGEMVACTGWGQRGTYRALERCLQAGVVVRVQTRSRYAYKAVA